MNLKGVSAMQFFEKKTLTYSLLILIVGLWFQVAGAYSETRIIGKVVHIADGDTITVLQNNIQHKIRLYGIDCPEKSQDFGNRAKQVLSEQVFDKQVQVTQKDIDRYGRVVGMVYVGNTCVNEEIIKAGLAWVYNQYCKDSVCSQWRSMEIQARQSRIGLWSHPDPVPPWEYRRGGSVSSETDNQAQKAEGNVYHGNVRSKVFHKADCKDFNCKSCTIIFHSRDEAIKAGFRPCGGCKP